jgi:hypothetical protein
MGEIMKVISIIILVFTFSESCRAEGFLQSMRAAAERAVQRVSEISNFNEAPVRQKAEQIKGLIQAEIDREYADLQPNDDGIYPASHGGHDRLVAHYDMGNADHRAQRARERLNARQEANECQSQQLGAVLVNELRNQCGVRDAISDCDNAARFVSGKLEQMRQRQIELAQPNGGRTNMRELASLQNRLIQEILPSTESPLNSCYQRLHTLASESCLSVYDQVFDQSMQHNLTYLCLPETVDREVDLFVEMVRSQEFSREIVTAQSHYAEGRRAQIALTHLAHELTTFLTQLTASHREEAPPTGDL